LQYRLCFEDGQRIGAGFRPHIRYDPHIRNPAARNAPFRSLRAAGAIRMGFTPGGERARGSGYADGASGAICNDLGKRK
jgi:hypothetical protein